MYHNKIDRQRRILSSGVAADDRKVYMSLMVRYFNARVVAIMVALTLSLLLLPLVLPPLPPPPVMILFIPVLIMALLVLLAFSPSQVPNLDVSSV